MIVKAKLFDKGIVLMTAQLAEDFNASTVFAAEVKESLARYSQQDWGTSSKADAMMNNAAVISGDDRIFAAYKTSKGKIYIITEADRSVTTVLYSSEY